MNFPLSGYLVYNDFFEGPEAVKFDLKEYRFHPTFHTYDESLKSFDRVLAAVKQCRLIEKGAYTWYPNHFGPIIIDNIETKDFKLVKGTNLLQEMDNLVDNINDRYFCIHDLPIERQIIKDKIHYLLRLIPFDTCIFFQYNVAVTPYNPGSKKLIEHNLFDYFYFLIGYNKEKFYLITLFYE
jgi:hypothetical protein